MGLEIQKWKCACGSTFVKIIWMLLSLKMCIMRLGQQAMLSEEFIGEQSDAEGENLFE